MLLLMADRCEKLLSTIDIHGVVQHQEWRSKKKVFSICNEGFNYKNLNTVLIVSGANILRGVSYPFLPIDDKLLASCLWP